MRISLAEENALVRLAKKGDDKAALQLLKLYKPLILSSSRRYENAGIADDLFSVGCASLLIAIRRFDESRGVNFAAFAKAMVIGDIKTEFVRFQRKRMRELPLENAADSIRATTTEESTTEKMDVEKAMLENLTERESRMIKAYFDGGFTLREIAKKLNISPQRAGKIVKKALQKIRPVLNRF